MATYSSIPSWEIPWTELSLAGLLSMGSQKSGHDLVTDQQQINNSPANSVCFAISIQLSFIPPIG